MFRRRIRRFSARRRYGGRRGYRQSRSLLSPERKYYDASDGGLLTNAPETLDGGPFNRIGLGTQANGRLGERIKIISLKCMIKIGGVQYSTYVPCPVKFYIILDRQANGTNCTPSDVFTSNSVTHVDMPFMNLAGRRRFRVMRVMKFGYSEASNVAVNTYSTGSGATEVTYGRTLLKSFRKRMRLTTIYTLTDSGAR